mmetsp:Transcript_16118/g.23549  ORF Transcript_16118/g.23549 Transcript_16118/m.23549 type:complete len:233 (+) Transcript_16118:227-925(+)
MLTFSKRRKVNTPYIIPTPNTGNMKLAILSLLAGSAAAFAPSSMMKTSSTSLKAAEDLVGALPPVGFFDPLGFAEKADENTMKRYREAELTHGRVSMLAVIGFLVGEKVEGSSFLFDASIKGPAITHLTQVPEGFWAILLITIGAAEQFRAEKGWVDPSEVPVDQPGLLKADYVAGDLGFDPLGLKPEDPEEFMIMQTKELQNGRLAMLAAAGFLAQELADGKGIVEHLQSM